MTYDRILDRENIFDSSFRFDERYVCDSDGGLDGACFLEWA